MFGSVGGRCGLQKFQAVRLLGTERNEAVQAGCTNQPKAVDVARPADANEAKVFNVVTRATWRTVADRYGSLGTNTI